MSPADPCPALTGRHAATSIAAALALFAGAAAAAGRVTLSAESIEFAGQRARGVTASLDHASGVGVRLRLTAAAVETPPGVGPVQHLDVTCPALIIASHRLRCAQASVSGRLGLLGEQRLALALDWRTATGLLEARAVGLRVASGTLTAGLSAQVADGALGRWHLDGEARSLDAAALAEILRPWRSLPQGWTLAGGLGVRATAEGNGTAAALSADVHVEGRGIGFANPAGSLAAEQLAPAFELHVERPRAAAAWRFAAAGRLPGGQLYVEPVYLDFAPHALAAKASGNVGADLSRVTLDALEITHAGVFGLHGRGVVLTGTAAPLHELRLTLDGLDLAAALPVWVGPALVGTVFKDLAGEGRVSGEIDVDAGLPSRLDLEFDRVTLDSPAGALGIQGLSGRFRWVEEDRRLDLAGTGTVEFGSELGWESGRLWGMELGASRVKFATSGRNFRLVEPAFVPVFDGGLAVDTLRVRHAGQPEMYVRLDATIRPINVARIGHGLGWPEFGGTLSGRIPDLTLRQGLVTLGGDVEAQVFGGRVVVRNLRLRNPLGQFPQLFADADVDALDLEQITSAFSFGRITGRLSGKVRGLETFDWAPVTFDARLYSTPGDRTRRRISQRAVANLSSIGGGSGTGVASALQSGFLRFFEEFNYARLGLSCRLRNDVCEMDGIGPARFGYYIVEGQGIPRIDVLGSQRRVAWTRLVRQLASISQSGGPVVR